jgi:hypothetical protein
MNRKPLLALVASILALPAAAVNVPPPPEPVDGFAPFAPVPPFDLPPPPAVPLKLAAADAAVANAEAWREWSRDLQRELETSLGALYAPRVASSKVVKGAPFSAEVVSENRRTLADGNVISRKSTGHFYRDRDGRTRDESEARDKHPGSIVISDPVAQQRYVLLPELRRAIATRASPGRSSSKQVVKVDGTEIRIEDGRVTINGKEVPNGRAELKAKTGRDIRVENGHVFIDGKEAGAGGGNGTRVTVRREEVDGLPTETVNVQAIRIGDDRDIPVPPIPPVPPVPPAAGVAPPPPPLPLLPGVDVMRFEGMGRLGKGEHANLGTKDIEGVRAEGKSTTWTIPAGQIGNRDPIKVVSESWYSPDLQVTVYSRYSDPRTGEAIYRLAAIKRGDPSPDLFKVPAGYEVRDRERVREELIDQAREKTREHVQDERERTREQVRQEKERARAEVGRQREDQRRQLDEQRRRLEDQRRQLEQRERQLEQQNRQLEEQDRKPG